MVDDPGDRGAARGCRLSVASALGLRGRSSENGEFRKAEGLARVFASAVSDSADVIDRMMSDRMLATSLRFPRQPEQRASSYRADAGPARDARDGSAG